MSFKQTSTDDGFVPLFSDQTVVMKRHLPTSSQGSVAISEGKPFGLPIGLLLRMLLLVILPCTLALILDIFNIGCASGRLEYFAMNKCLLGHCIMTGFGSLTIMPASWNDGMIAVLVGICIHACCHCDHVRGECWTVSYKPVGA